MTTFVPLAVVSCSKENCPLSDWPKALKETGPSVPTFRYGPATTLSTTLLPPITNVLLTAVRVRVQRQRDAAGELEVLRQRRRERERGGYRRGDAVVAHQDRARGDRDRDQRLRAVAELELDVADGDADGAGGVLVERELAAERLAEDVELEAVPVTLIFLVTVSNWTLNEPANVTPGTLTRDRRGDLAGDARGGDRQQAGAVGDDDEVAAVGADPQAEVGDRDARDR